MSRRVLWIATNNQDKKQEFQLLLPGYEIKTLSDLDFKYEEPWENGKTFAQNALLKAKSLALLTQELTIGDDSGICVRALGDFPGIYSKRWAAPIEDFTLICQLLLDKLKLAVGDKSNRQAKMVTVLGLYDPQTRTECFFEGQVRGNLSQEVKIGLGEGFGYDFIFQPDSQQKTYSEMGQIEKNQFSSRQIAVKKLQTYLESEIKTNA